MLNDHPRQQLTFIIQQYGRAICSEPKRCEAMLRDLCPQHKREVNLLVAALKERVVEELLNTSVNVPFELTLKRLSQRLHENLGTAEDFAEWAVESWALSLNIIHQSIPNQAVQANAKVSPIPTKLVTSSTSNQQRIGKFIVQDGIAIDIETGLMWLPFAYGQSWQNNTAVGNAKTVTWEEAFEVAKRFNQQGGYAYLTDWRLPTTGELYTLIDKPKDMLLRNCIDTDVFPKTFSDSKGYGRYWSTSTGYYETVDILNFSMGRS